MGAFRAATAEQAGYLRDLLASGLLVETGVAGVYGQGADFVEVREAFSRAITRVATPDRAEAMRFPPLLPRQQIETNGYLGSFPHLAGSIFSFEGTDAQALELEARAARHEDWSELQSMTDLVLLPAACYPIYPEIAKRGPLPRGGATIDTGSSWVFRREPSDDPARMQIFHMHELVRIGDPDDVAAFRDDWLVRAVELFRRLGIEASSELATDPFFGRVGRMLAANQRAQELKFELVAMIGGPEPTAIVVVQLPPGPLHEGLWHQPGGRWRGAHGVHRHRRGAGHAGAVPGQRVRHGCLAGGGTSGAVAVSRTGGGMVSLFGHDPATYRPHAIHSGARNYIETNCFTDIVAELLHARGDEPLASFGSFVRMDFENDQWTFFKPLAVDLEVLFGVDIHEVQPYRRIPEQIEEVIALGRTMTIELDAWYLPDTAATSYGTAHVKTGVIAEAIDLAGERFRYYHNASLYELSGDDFQGAFRTQPGWSGDVLPPYTELIRFDAGPRLQGDELRAVSRDLLAGHLRRVVPGNPFDRFNARLIADLPALLEGDAERYHAFTFATFRMAGAGFELLASEVEWLLGEDGSRSIAAMSRIVEGCKVLGFKLARRRPFDPTEAMDALGAAWTEAMESLDDALR